MILFVRCDWLEQQ